VPAVLYWRSCRGTRDQVVPADRDARFCRLRLRDRLGSKCCQIPHARIAGTHGTWRYDAQRVVHAWTRIYRDAPSRKARAMSRHAIGDTSVSLDERHQRRPAEAKAAGTQCPCRRGRAARRPRGNLGRGPPPEKMTWRITFSTGLRRGHRPGRVVSGRCGSAVKQT